MKDGTRWQLKPVSEPETHGAIGGQMDFERNYALGTSWMNRFVTQIFFPGEPLNETDLLLNGVPGQDVRQRLIFEFTGTVMGDFK